MLPGSPRQVKKACERPRSAQEARPAGQIFKPLGLFSASHLHWMRGWFLRSAVEFRGVSADSNFHLFCGADSWHNGSAGTDTDASFPRPVIARTDCGYR